MLFLHTFYVYSLPLLFSLVFIWKLLSNKKTQRNLPPSPSKLPVIGNLHQLGILPHRSLQSLAQKHGHLMLLHFGSKPVLIVSSADGAHEIMKTHDLIFATRPKTIIASTIFYSKGVLFSPYGEYWRQVRSICVLQLLSNKRVKSFRRVREEETTVMVEKIKQSYSSSSPFNLSEMLISLTNDVACCVALGTKYTGEKSGSLKELFGELMEVLGAFNVGDYIPWLAWFNHFNGLNAKVEKVAKEFDTIIERVLEEHMDHRRSDVASMEHEQGQEYFIDVLLGLQRENTIGFSVQRDTVKALLMDMFVGGTESVSTSLEWQMTEMLRQPKVMKKLQDEVRGITKGKDEEINEDDLEKMLYLKAVIRENLRLHPPAPLLVPREAIEDVRVMGYDIAAGTTVIINAWAIGHDPSLWEDPEKFNPDRFLNTSMDYKGQNFQYIPFGAGRRGCPGIQFAMTLNEVALAKLVNKFDFGLPNGARGQDLDITEAPGINICRKYPLLLTATPYIC